MICPICRIRWTVRKGRTDFLELMKFKDASECYESNEIMCCGDPHCLRIALIMNQNEKERDKLFEEIKREAEETPLQWEPNKWGTCDRISICREKFR